MVIQDKTLSDIWEALYSGDMIVEALDEEFITGNRRKEGAVIFCALVDRLKASNDDEEIQHLVGLIAGMLQIGMSPFVVSSEGKRPYDLLPESDDGLKKIFEDYRAKPDDLEEEITALFRDIEKGQICIESFIQLYDTGLDLSSCVRPGRKLSLFQAVNTCGNPEKFIAMNWLKHYPTRYSQDINQALQDQLEHQLGFKNAGDLVKECLIKGAKANCVRTKYRDTYLDYTLKVSAYTNSAYLLLFGAHFGNQHPKSDWPNELMAVWKWRKTFCDSLTNELIAAAYLGNINVVEDYFDRKPPFLSKFIETNRNGLEVLAMNCGWTQVRDYIRKQLDSHKELYEAVYSMLKPASNTKKVREVEKKEPPVSQSGADGYPDPDAGGVGIGTSDNFSNSPTGEQPGVSLNGFFDQGTSGSETTTDKVAGSALTAESDKDSQFVDDNAFPDPDINSGTQSVTSDGLGCTIGGDPEGDFLRNKKFSEFVTLYEQTKFPVQLHPFLRDAVTEITKWEVSDGVKEDFRHFFFAQSVEELKQYYDSEERLDSFNSRKELLLCLKLYCVNSLCKGTS
jgi:hypothetical protein